MALPGGTFWRRFLRDAAVALFVGAVLVALAMVIDDSPDAPAPAPAQEDPVR